MTRIGWLADEATMIGGAELTQDEFKTAAPEDVEIIECLPGNVQAGLDRYVIHNCVLYDLDDLEQIDGPAIKYWHDVGPHLQDGVKEWLHENAVNVCCSPVQADYMGISHVRCIPPPVDLGRFEEAAVQVNGDRAGQVSVGSWRNYGKAPHKVIEWSQQNGPVDFFGDGPFAPHGSIPVPYDAMPALLARYETFIFLPMVLEPFGRLVVEAWAAGCAIVTNGQVGARWWIENDPDAIETASRDFWELVMST